MPDRIGKKMLTVWVDQDDHEALQTLCKTTGTTVSKVLRDWIITSIQEQSTNLVPAPQEGTSTPSDGHFAAPAVLKELMGRLASLEQAIPKFEVSDLVRMKQEILSGEFGSLRYRMGIVESLLQQQGGSIAWDSKKSSGPNVSKNLNQDHMSENQVP